MAGDRRQNEEKQQGVVLSRNSLPQRVGSEALNNFGKGEWNGEE
jgi:hypothetical protein